MSIPLMILFALGFGYLIAATTLATTQHRRVFMPRPGLDRTPADEGLDHEDVTLEAADGQRLHAWWLPPGSWAERPFTLLYLHGAGTNLSGQIEALRFWHELGFAILALDYRGYGRSLGRPTEAGLHRDARAAWDHLVQVRGADVNHIVLFGVSLGVSVAAALAADVKPVAVILEGGFTSVADVAVRRYPWLPARQLTHIQLSAEIPLRTLRSRKLFIHSLEDRTVPYAVGLRLYRAAAEPKTLLRIQGPHAQAHLAAPERVAAAVREFVAGLSLKSDGPGAA